MNDSHVELYTSCSNKAINMVKTKKLVSLNAWKFPRPGLKNFKVAAEFKSFSLSKILESFAENGKLVPWLVFSLGAAGLSIIAGALLEWGGFSVVGKKHQHCQLVGGVCMEHTRTRSPRTQISL